MSVFELLGLTPTDDPLRFELHVHPGITTRGGALQGGAALGAAVEAMKTATGRPLVWATAHFLRHGAGDAQLDLEIDIGVRGHKVTQAQALLTGGNDEVMRVVAGLGARGTDLDRTFADMPPAQHPDECPPREDPMMPGLEARRAIGRSRVELDGSHGPGRSASWFRLRGGRRALTPGELAVISDCSALEVSDAVGVHCVSNSLDNTLRVAQSAETDWVLVDAQISSVTQGFATVSAHLWSEDATLLAVFAQTLIVRETDAEGLPIRSTKRFAGGDGSST